MNHNKIAEQLHYLSKTRSYTAFHSQEEREGICQGCDGDFCRERVHDAHKCIYEALSVGATAIYDLTALLEVEQRKNAELLARAEAAEKMAKEREILALQLLGYTYDMPRLRELLCATQEGRCVVFKFGIGSTVYRAWIRPDGRCPYISADIVRTVKDMLNAEEWDNAYHTYQEAEKALKECGKGVDNQNSG